MYGKAGAFPARIPVTSLNGTNGFIVDGTGVAGHAGTSVSAAGDVNGDGLGDLLVSAKPIPSFGDANTSGGAYVVFGKAGATLGAKVSLATLNGANGFRILGRNPGDYAGVSVSAAGDVNGDGFDDVIVGASAAATRGLRSGEAYVVYGKAAAFPSSLSVTALDGANGFTLYGTSSGDHAGLSVSAAGDVNGDGFDDLLVGSNGTPAGRSRAGVSYLIQGFDSGAVTQHGGPGNDTLTGDDGVNVMIGGQGNDLFLNNGSLDVVRGGQGDDIFSGGSFSKGRQQRLVGGHGFDTIVLNGNTLLDLTARPVYRITGFEEVDLRPGVNYLSLDARAVVNASPNTNTLIVRADAGDVVNIGNGWTATGTEVIDGDTFSVLTQGAAILKLSSAFAPLVTLVNATTATYTDVDGDLVTIKTSKGTLGYSDFFLFSSGANGGAQLAAINFGDDGTEFQDADLSITATPSAIGGDGHVNVGRIDATGVDLGKVIIDGDLGALSAGEATVTTPGLDLLQVNSLGIFGLSTQAGGGALSCNVNGTWGTLAVATDVVNMSLVAAGGGVAFGSIKIGGSLRGDPAAGGDGLHAFGNVGSLAIGGDVRSSQAPGFDIIGVAGDLGSFTLGGSLVRVGGASEQSATITFAKVGTMTIGGDLDGGRIFAYNGIKSLAVTGSVLGAQVLAGYNFAGTPSNGDAMIGAVTVGGDWVASNLVAGAKTTDPYFGNGGDALIPGGDPAKIAKITSIAIKGEALGTPGGVDNFGFIAEEIGSLTVGGTKFPLAAGASNDLAGLNVGTTIDLRVREVNATTPPVQAPFTGNGTSPAIVSPLSLGSLDGNNGFQLNGATNGARAGFAVHAGGDVNGDGIDDVLITETGAAYVVFGTVDGFNAALNLGALDGTNGFKLAGNGVGRSVGAARRPPLPKP
ncbi:MAG TPA: hypothetical protein VGO11_06980 [Chthoniobacteraceae bacterium]|nr:hypothetical protein [Chthoniobacteraceae bacterium]